MRLETKTWALIPFAVALNVTVGWTVSSLPVHLDALGTCLVAVLAGPVAGMLTGGISNLLSAIQNPIWLRYFPVAVLLGALFGLLGRANMMRTPLLAALSGAAVGICSACLAAPITAWCGGASGGGTDLFVAAFRQSGYRDLESCLAQSLLVDPLDKLVTCLAIQFLLTLMPQRLLAAFAPQGKVGHFESWKWRPKFGSGGSAAERRVDLAVVTGMPSLHVPGNSFLHRFSPGTKLLAVICAIFMAFTIPAFTGASPGHNPTIPVIVFPCLISVLLLLGGICGVGFELGRLLTFTALPVTIALLFINGLWGNGPTLPWCGLLWHMDGVLYAVHLAYGITLIVESIGLLILTTPIAQLCDYLEHRGMPARLNYVILASLTLIPALQRRAADIRVAQAARALPVGQGFWSNLRSFFPTLMPLLLSVLSDAQERALALEVRGFGAADQRTWWSEVPPLSYERSAQALILMMTFALEMWFYE